MYDTERLTVRIPKKDIRKMDEFIEAGEFSNRSELIRHSISEFKYKHTDELVERFKKGVYDGASPSFVGLIKADEKYRKKYDIEFHPFPSVEKFKNSEYVFGSNGRWFASDYPYDF